MSPPNPFDSTNDVTDVNFRELIDPSAHQLNDPTLNHIVPTLFGSKTAYDYQISSVEEVISSLEQGHTRICIVQPTGCGKTITAGLLITNDKLRLALDLQNDVPVRVVMVAHRHRLLSQALESFDGINGIRSLYDTQYMTTPMCKGWTGTCTDRVLFHTLSSFGTIPNDLMWDLLLYDEAHHESCLTFQYKLEQISHAPIVGLTATPDRPDGTLIKFSKFVEKISRKDAVRLGYLSSSSLFSFIDSPSREHVEMVVDIVDLKLDTIGQTMIFVRTKREVRLVVEQLIKRGLTAIALVDVREKVLNVALSSFEHKEIQFIVSCNKIGEGTDVKNCESIILGRITQSETLLNQMIGRTARKDSDSNVYEIVNPLSNNNIDTATMINPHHHEIWYKIRNEWRHTIATGGA